MNKEYVKHLVRCKCILPQYRQMTDPPFHKFVVFSELNQDALVVQSLAMCPACGAVHKIREVGLSDILRKEDAPSILTIDELKTSLPDKLQTALIGYDLELHQWQEMKWILDNETWGRSVILTRDTADGLTSGKYLQFFGPLNWKFSGFTREDLLAEK